jgi:hypothetical protein
MYQQPLHPRSTESTNSFNLEDCGSYFTSPAAITSQPVPAAQSNHAQLSQEMVTDTMMYQGLECQYPYYPVEPLSKPPGAPALLQQVPEYLPSRRRNTSVLTPQDKQEHALLGARAAGHNNFDTTVVDYHTECFDGGSAVNQAQKTSRGTRLRGVLGCLSHNTSDVQDSHVEIRRAAELLCMTDMAGLVDNSKFEQSGTKSSGKLLGSEGERARELPTVFQHQVSKLLSINLSAHQLPVRAALYEWIATSPKYSPT